MRPSCRLPPFPATGSQSPAHRSYAWWSRLSPFARDITLVLIVKAIVLGLLWFAFFRAPAAPRMEMDPQRVEQNMLAPAPSPEPPHAVR